MYPVVTVDSLSVLLSVAKETHGEIPAAALDVKSIDGLAENVDIGRLHRGVSATVQHEILIGAAAYGPNYRIMLRSRGIIGNTSHSKSNKQVNLAGKPSRPRGSGIHVQKILSFVCVFGEKIT